MNKYKTIVIEGINDWSTIDKDKLPNDILCASNMRSVDIEQMGIYVTEKGQYHSSGYVGIRKLKNKNGSYCKSERDGRDFAVKIMPRFNLDPWDMLVTVMQDSEYEKYVKDDSERFFKVFYEDSPIEVSTADRGGELILALGFIKCCSDICKKHLKSQMSFTENNFYGKVRGSIQINKQIKRNICMGREDKVYCKYPQFSIDTIENQILKSSLKKAETIIKQALVDLPDIGPMIQYCKTSLQQVNSVNVTKKDFTKVTVTGFNAYYKPAIELAKAIICHCSMSLDNNLNEKRAIIPYAIRMETLFEFYIRAMFRKFLNKQNILRLADYKDINAGKILRTIDEKNRSNETYLMDEYIPDIILQKKDAKNNVWNYVAVFDVKYQNYINKVYSETRRHNSHQLLFYMLLLNVNKCGFIFPKSSGSDTENKCQLLIQDGNVEKSQREYSQWSIGCDKGKIDKDFEKLVNYLFDKKK